MSGESRVVFKHCAEALVRGLAPRMTAPLEGQLQRLGLAEGHELPPAFEYERWQQILAATAAELSPTDAWAGHHLLGELVTSSSGACG